MYTNQAFHDIFGSDIGAPHQIVPWSSMFDDEHLPAALEFWRHVTVDKVTATIEIRMKRMALVPVLAPADPYRWVLFTCIPEFHLNGSVKHVTGCITDVTEMKLAEELQKQRVEDVTEARKQQEAFIDMTRLVAKQEQELASRRQQLTFSQP